MFWGTSSFNQNIGGWSVDNVYEMGMMFHQPRPSTRTLRWSVDNVRDMHQMFGSACVVQSEHRRLERRTSHEHGVDVQQRPAFDQDLSAWETSAVTNMHHMFGYASSFNQDISAWNVENVMHMHNMFHYASAFSQNLNWCLGDDVNLDEAFSGRSCARRRLAASNRVLQQLRAVARADYDRPHDQCRPYDGRLPIDRRIRLRGPHALLLRSRGRDPQRPARRR